jgi:hypothetical protein
MIKAIQRFFQEREFKKRFKAYQEKITPYVLGYENGSYELNTHKVVKDWRNDWEVIWFSDTHIILKLLDVDKDYIRISKQSAESVIKSLALERYGLLCQEGYRYRENEWRPKNTTYTAGV